MQIEVVTFTVTTDDESFLALNDRFQENVAYRSPGLLRRTVACGDNGEWLDIRLWSDDSPRTMTGDASVTSEWNAVVTNLSSHTYRAL
ncbi:MAG: hypothetical protein ACO36A_03815 [Ilumatobacteraceae bacterium]